MRIFCPALLQLRLNGLQNNVCRGKVLGVNIFPKRPATFAVDAVERTDFHVSRGDVDAQRAAQAAAVNGSESDGFPEEHRGQVLGYRVQLIGDRG